MRLRHKHTLKHTLHHSRERDEAKAVLMLSFFSSVKPVKWFLNNKYSKSVTFGSVPNCCCCAKTFSTKLFTLFTWSLKLHLSKCKTLMLRLMLMLGLTHSSCFLRSSWLKMCILRGFNYFFLLNSMLLKIRHDFKRLMKQKPHILSAHHYIFCFFFIWN